MAFHGPIYFSKLISGCSPVMLDSIPPPQGPWTSCSLCLLTLALLDLPHPSDLSVNITSWWYYSSKWIYPSLTSLIQEICAEHCAGIKWGMTSWSPQCTRRTNYREVNTMNQQVWWRRHKREDIYFIPDDPKGLSEEVILKLNGERLQWEDGLLLSITPWLCNATVHSSVFALKESKHLRSVSASANRLNCIPSTEDSANHLGGIQCTLMN